MLIQHFHILFIYQVLFLQPRALLQIIFVSVHTIIDQSHCEIDVWHFSSIWSSGNSFHLTETARRLTVNETWTSTYFSTFSFSLNAKYAFFFHLLSESNWNNRFEICYCCNSHAQLTMMMLNEHKSLSYLTVSLAK